MDILFAKIAEMSCRELFRHFAKNVANPLTETSMTNFVVKTATV
jgi:hypothetical protein